MRNQGFHYTQIELHLHSLYPQEKNHLAVVTLRVKYILNYSTAFFKTLKLEAHIA